MARSKTIKTASPEVNEITINNINRAYIKFSNEVGIDIQFKIDTRELEAKLYNINDNLTLTGKVVLTEEE